MCTQWYPEVNHFCRDVPVILIGCKTDLRKDKEKMRKLRALDLEPITYTQVTDDIMLTSHTKAPEHATENRQMNKSVDNTQFTVCSV